MICSARGAHRKREASVFRGPVGRGRTEQAHGSAQSTPESGSFSKARRVPARRRVFDFYTPCRPGPRTTPSKGTGVYLPSAFAARKCFFVRRAFFTQGPAGCSPHRVLQPARRCGVRLRCVSARGDRTRYRRPRIFPDTAFGSPTAPAFCRSWSSTGHARRCARMCASPSVRAGDHHRAAPTARHAQAACVSAEIQRIGQAAARIGAVSIFGAELQVPASTGSGCASTSRAAAEEHPRRRLSSAVW